MKHHVKNWTLNIILDESKTVEAVFKQLAENTYLSSFPKKNGRGIRSKSIRRFGSTRLCEVSMFKL